MNKLILHLPQSVVEDFIAGRDAVLTVSKVDATNMLSLEVLLHRAYHLSLSDRETGKLVGLSHETVRQRWEQMGLDTSVRAGHKQRRNEERETNRYGIPFAKEAIDN